MLMADCVFINGKVVTVDKTFSYKKAIAIKDGWIIDVGENAEIKQYIRPDTMVIDLKGKVILPGAHDAHAHAIVFGTNLLNCDCSFPKVKTITDLQAQLAETVQDMPAGKWIRGNGLNTENFDECKENPARAVTRHDLDTVTPNNPVIILNWSGHGILVNSKALEVCGIDQDTKDPSFGVIERDENGMPTGVFLEADSMALISEHVPLWTNEELRTFILEIQRLLNKEGYTSYTECTLGPAGNQRDSGASGDRGIGIYKQLLDEGLLTARVSIGFYTGSNGTQSYEGMLHDLDTFKMPEIKDPNWLNIPMIKIFCDGVHFGHTAWLIDDYLDQPGFHGRSCFAGDTDEEQEKELHRMIMLAHERGYQVGIHTIGDRAVKSSIEGIIKAIQTHPRKNPRHYVIHAESMGTNEMILRAAKFGIMVSVQPGLADFLYEPSIACIGPKGRRMFGLKEFMNLGVILAGGSDSLNGEYCNWRKAIQSAVTRRSRITGEVYCPELAITVEEGIRLFTYNGAYQEGFEQVRGSIEIGKVADFQVLDQDIFQVDPEDIGKIQVEMTMVGGKIVYRK